MKSLLLLTFVSHSKPGTYLADTAIWRAVPYGAVPRGPHPPVELGKMKKDNRQLWLMAKFGPEATRGLRGLGSTSATRVSPPVVGGASPTQGC